MKIAIMLIAFAVVLTGCASSDQNGENTPAKTTTTTPPWPPPSPNTMNNPPPNYNSPGSH